MSRLISVRVLSVLTVLLCIVPVAGQTRPPKQLNATEIFKRSIKALGNEKTVKAVTSTSFSGNVDGKGRFTLELQTPNQARLELFPEGANRVALGNNGFSTWRVTPTGAASTLVDDPGKNLSVFFDVLANHNLELPLKWLSAFSHPTESLNGRECQVVEFRSLERGAVVMYFDAQTFLPVRLECGRQENLARFDFDDYRVVDGIREPFQIRFQDGDAPPVVLNVERIQHATVFAPNHFDIPGERANDIDLTALSTRLIDNLVKSSTSLSDYSFTATLTRRHTNEVNVFLRKDVQKNEVYPVPGERSKNYPTRFFPLIWLLSDNDPRNLRLVESFLGRKNTPYLREEQERRKRGGERKPIFYVPYHLSEILRKSDLMNPRREMFREHSVIVCDFRPKPGNKEKRLGTLWIDQADGQVWRYKDWIDLDYNPGTGLVSSPNRRSIFMNEQVRTPEGQWRPHWSYEVEEKMSWEIVYGDFKRFTDSDFETLVRTTEEFMRRIH